MQQPQLNLSLDKTTEVICEHCGNNTFKQSLMLRTASKFVTGTPEDAIVPIPVFACDKCGHINEKFIPKELRDLQSKK